MGNGEVKLTTTEPKKFLSYAAHCQIENLQYSQGRELSKAEIDAFVEKESPLAAGAEGEIIFHTFDGKWRVKFKNAATGTYRSCDVTEPDSEGDVSEDSCTFEDHYVVSEEYLQSAIVEREEKCPITGGNRWVTQRVDPELREEEPGWTVTSQARFLEDLKACRERGAMKRWRTKVHKPREPRQTA